MSNDTVWGEGPVTPVVPTFPPTQAGQAYNDIPAGVPVTNPADLPPASAVVDTKPGEYKGLPVRADGDRVFILKGGKKYWVTTPQVYAKLGFKFGDEVKLDQTTLNVIPEGEPIR